MKTEQEIRGHVTRLREQQGELCQAHPVDTQRMDIAWEKEQALLWVLDLPFADPFTKNETPAPDGALEE